MKKLITTSVFMLLNLFASWAQCTPNITIFGPTYTTTLTQSSTWIATSGVLNIPTGADVTLNGNPTANGYVLLDTGFETSPNAIFLAQMVDCTLGVNESSLTDLFTMYPNPTNGFVTINSNTIIEKYTLYDLNGRILQSKMSKENVQTVDLTNLSSGVYLLEVTAENRKSVQKIIKN